MQTDGEFQYEITQELPFSQADAFRYFADETKLDSLTPSWMRFRVLGKTHSQLQEGTLIDYRLTLHRFPLHWRSRIVDWDPSNGFAYLQAKGPFAYFKHSHLFQTTQTGTLMTDRVIYRLRGGFLANWWIQPFVHQELNRIFQYRKRVIDQNKRESVL